MTMPISTRASILSGSFVLGLAACYTVEFDEQKDDAYYCQSADECLETQSCEQFRCVDDRGPHIVISGPEEEPPTVFPLDQATLNVSLDVKDLMLDEGNSVDEGKGKVELSIDPHIETASPITSLIDTESAQISLGSGLEHGPHRLVAQAVFGDGTAYPNPSARDHTVFFSSDGSERPQIAILEPGPGHVHVAGEPLAVRVINIGFDFVDNGMDCNVEDNCDPFALDAMCLVTGDGCTEISKNGHTHIYMLPNYPDCLITSETVLVGCNENYIATVRPNGGPGGNEVSTVIEGDRFNEPGTFMLSAGMQYNSHAPYPNKEFIIFDQIPITIVER